MLLTLITMSDACAVMTLRTNTGHTVPSCSCTLYVDWLKLSWLPNQNKLAKELHMAINDLQIVIYITDNVYNDY